MNGPCAAECCEVFGLRRMPVAAFNHQIAALDGATGEIIWRRRVSGGRLGETDVAAIPSTDLLLINLEQGKRARVEATDVLSGATIWQSEKMRGQIMQMAVDLEADLLAVVCVRDAKGRARENFKRHPVVHLLSLSTGDELWKREIGSNVEMMPARWNTDDEVEYTLDNYHPPFFLDHRLYLFYEGVTSYDEQSGDEGERDRFRVNEEGLALTEADPVADENYIYLSGRGHVRAVSRANSKVVWEAKDLGLTPEMILAGDVLYVRTGGQFTKIKNGETIERGPYGVSAINATNGKTIWRYKGADKGITNCILLDERTIVVADHDELISLDRSTGKRLKTSRHKVEKAAFILVNERGEIVIGGQNEVAGFVPASGENVWRARHNPPGRGLLSIAGAIALRAASLYFRYGGLASTALRGAQLARTINSLRWSGLASRVAMPNLTSLAVNSSREYVASRFRAFGLAARLEQGARRAQNIRNIDVPRPSIDVEDRLLDRLDPARQLDRLSAFLLRRRRLAALRGQWMYFYTELQGGGRGLAGVSVQTGSTEREIDIENLDERFLVDEVTSALYTAKDNKLVAYRVK